MLYSEIIAVCFQIHTKHTNTLCGQNLECRTYHAVNTPSWLYKPVSQCCVSTYCHPPKLCRDSDMSDVSREYVIREEVPRTRTVKVDSAVPDNLFWPRKKYMFVKLRKIYRKYDGRKTNGTLRRRHFHLNCIWVIRLVISRWRCRSRWRLLEELKHWTVTKSGSCLYSIY